MKNLSMQEMFRLHRRGVKLQARTIADLELDKLDIKHPSELVANSPLLQQIAEKHWQCLIAPKLRAK